MLLLDFIGIPATNDTATPSKRRDSGYILAMHFNGSIILFELMVLPDYR